MEKCIFFANIFGHIKKKQYLCTRFRNSRKVFMNLATKSHAQMAESVDALVSNTSRFTPVPVRPRLWVQEKNYV